MVSPALMPTALVLQGIGTISVIEPTVRTVKSWPRTSGTGGPGGGRQPTGSGPSAVLVTVIELSITKPLRSRTGRAKGVATACVSWGTNVSASSNRSSSYATDAPSP